MKKRTKKLQISIKIAEKVGERDNYTCLFCKNGYHIDNQNLSNLEFLIHDIAHFIPRSQGGLGIEENLIVLCRYHHHMLDNGNNGLRNEMLDIIEKYLKTQYTDWEKERLAYRKWDF